MIGISASGRTPYVVAAVEYASAAGPYRGRHLQPDTALAAAADMTIVAEVGPEVVSGSTRMKAGPPRR